MLLLSLKCFHVLPSNLANYSSVMTHLNVPTLEYSFLTCHSWEYLCLLLYEHLLHVVMIGCISFSHLLFDFFLLWSINYVRTGIVAERFTIVFSVPNTMSWVWHTVGICNKYLLITWMNEGAPSFGGTSRRTRQKLNGLWLTIFRGPILCLSLEVTQHYFPCLLLVGLVQFRFPERRVRLSVPLRGLWQSLENTVCHDTLFRAGY